MRLSRMSGITAQGLVENKFTLFWTSHRRPPTTGWHGLPSSRVARAEGSEDDIVICNFDETLDGLDDDFDDDDFDSSSRPHEGLAQLK